TTAGGGWTVLGHYRYPGNGNAPGDIDNRDYAYYMRSRTRQAFGLEGYYGDPNSPGPWMDWRSLDGIGFPAEMAVVLDMNDFSSGWENYDRKVIYRVKTADQLPNYGTDQDLTTGDNLYWKRNPGDAWADVGGNTSSGTYYWYTRHPNDNYLVLFHASNYRYLDGRGATNHQHSAYWGAGMGGNNSWHHSAKILIRETAPPAAAEANEIRLALGADGVRTWADNSLSATCKQYRNPPAGKAYRGDIGSGWYRLRTPAGDIKAFCDMHSNGGGWTLVSFYRHPGYQNAPAGHENRDYDLYMHARDNVAIGNAAYIGDPDSAGAWADWRLLSAVSFPLEMSVLLGRGLPYLGDFSGTSAKVIYRVKDRTVMPNSTTSQDLVTGDNLYYKLNPGDNWTDVGGNSASGIYYWYPRASNNNYLTLLHESNYAYLRDVPRGATNYHYSFYYGSGMGGPNDWHYSGHMFVRELN
ncbi:MAG: hypothetical protein KC613_26305, partial [Myxococcales bacterium]|nr:hypothetical protein [Myxococcales bacterium]